MNRQQQTNNTKSTCLACVNKDFPSDAHTCIKCFKNVHILEGCSVSIGSEEGYGEKRLCMACSETEKNSNVDNCSITANAKSPSSTAIESPDVSSNIESPPSTAIQCIVEDQSQISLNKTNNVLEKMGYSRDEEIPRPVSLRSTLNANYSKSTCLACMNEDFPSGAHKCIKCFKNVHLLEGCSVSIGLEEGHGEKRLCMTCSETEKNSNANDSSTKANKNSATPARRNCQGTSKNYVEKNNYRRVAKYSGHRPDDIRDSLMWKKDTPISVIKNGSRPELASLKLDGKEISLRNTCAFDSLLYLQFFAAHDFPHIKNKVFI